MGPLDIIGQVFGAWLGGEVPNLLDNLGSYFAKRAVAKLPLEFRDQYAEEWGAFMQDLKSPTLKFCHGLHLLISARKIARELEPEASAPIALSRVIDFSFATVALILCAPLMLTIALALRLSAGPILVGWRRQAKGKSFTIYKFATLHPARTSLRLNRFLRRTSLDELPQLYNVWKGDMTLIGPRLSDAEASKPGLATSWWEIFSVWKGIWQKIARRWKGSRRE